MSKSDLCIVSGLVAALASSSIMWMLEIPSSWGAVGGTVVIGVIVGTIVSSCHS